MLINFIGLFFDFFEERVKSVRVNVNFPDLCIALEQDFLMYQYQYLASKRQKSRDTYTNKNMLINIIGLFFRLF